MHNFFWGRCAKDPFKVSYNRMQALLKLIDWFIITCDGLLSALDHCDFFWWCHINKASQKNTNRNHSQGKWHSEKKCTMMSATKVVFQEPLIHTITGIPMLLSVLSSKLYIVGKVSSVFRTYGDWLRVCAVFHLSCLIVISSIFCGGVYYIGSQISNCHFYCWS